MGVLAGRIPRKVDEGHLAEVKKKFAGLVKSFIAFTQNYGLVLAGQEVDFYRHAPGIEIIDALEQFGVAVCNRGADFWQGKR